MPKLPRQTAQVFAGALAPSGNIAQFGSLKAASPAYAATPDQAMTAAWAQGIAACLINASGGLQAPPWQDLNAILWVLSYFMANQAERGILDYDVGTTYWNGGMAQDGSGNIYVSQQDANIGNALNVTNWWLPLAATLKGPNLCKAWASFDGINVDGSGNSYILASYGVDHIQKLASGAYRVFFKSPTPMADAHYTMVGASGTQDGNIPGSGDNCTICGGVGTNPVTRTTAACDVFAWYAGNSGGSPGPVNPGIVTVNFFGN